MIVCSIDPGVVTGIVVANLERGEIYCCEVDCGEITGSGDWVSSELSLVAWLVRFVQVVGVGSDMGDAGGTSGGCDVVLMEDFGLRVGVTSLSRAVLLPARVGISVLYGLRCGSWKGEFKFVPPSEMGVIDNERLRALGFWAVGGKGHARDAMRHLVIELRATKYRNLTNAQAEWTISKVKNITV